MRSSAPGKFFANLFADLRDRHLLPVVALLVVALFAVPMLLGGGDEPVDGGADSASVAVDQPFETDPVVLASQPELRSYRKRLDRFQTRNPFNQYLPKDPAGEGGAGAQDASEALPTDSAGLPDTGATDIPTELPADVSEDPVLPPTDGGTDTEPSEPADDGDGTGEATLLTTRVDVRMGPVGDVKVYKDVKFLEFLPDRRTPVVEYLQSDFDLSNAVFIVSSFVLDTEGDGKCAPSPADCQFLQLEVGEEQALQYNDGKRYRLKLLDVDLHEEPFPEAGAESAGRVPDFGTTAPVGKVLGG